MKIRKVTYTKHLPGKVERHMIAFLTRSGETVLHGNFLNIAHTTSVATHIMKGEKSSTSFFPFPIGLAWDTEEYNRDLVDMAKAGELIDCVVIENAPDSTEELWRFARRILQESRT